MIIYSEDLRGWPPLPIDGRIIGDAICWGFTPESPNTGRIEIHVPESGVLICSGFDVEAMWIESPSSVTIHYTPPDLLVLTCGQAVDNDLTIPQLQSICTQLSLSTEGTQQELIDRIKEHLGI